MADLNAHFSKKQLACRCCGQLKMDDRLLAGLEALRNPAGAPIIVHDAYRCPEHNEQLGGVQNSEHTRGMAADVNIPDVPCSRCTNWHFRYRNSRAAASARTMADFYMWTSVITHPAGHVCGASMLGFSTS